MPETEASPLPAFYLPGLTEADIGVFTPLEFGSDGARVKMHSPVLTPELLRRIITDLHKAREEYLVHQPVSRIVETIEKVLTLWRNPDYQPRRDAEAFLPVITGFSPATINQILSGFFTMFTTETLTKLLEDELGDPLVLDEFRPRLITGGFHKAYGPRLTTAVIAGNVPGIPLVNVVYSLLLKSAILAKSSSAEPLFGVLFAHSVAEVDPELAKCMAMLCWKRGDEEIEKLAFGASDAVIVYGSDHSVGEVRKRVLPGTTFIPYGHKLSFGVIGREALSNERVKETATSAATDASALDQQGCVSPHVFYVEEGGEVSPKEFSGHLAEAMEAFNKQIPRGRLTPDESAHINQLRGSYEFRGFADEDIALHASSPGTSWTVIYEADQTFVPSCLNRTIRVKPVEDVMDVVKLVTPVKTYLQTMGAGLPREQLMRLAEKMGKLGMDRIAPLGRMTAPSVFWRHDGRFNLLGLIRWTDIES